MATDLVDHTSLAVCGLPETQPMKLVPGQWILVVDEDLAERLRTSVRNHNESPKKLLKALLCPCDTALICDLGVTKCEDVQQ